MFFPSCKPRGCVVTFEQGSTFLSLTAGHITGPDLELKRPRLWPIRTDSLIIYKFWHFQMAPAAAPTMPSQSPAHWVKTRILRILPRHSFLTIHWTYFLVVCTVFSVIFWLSTKPHSGNSLAYIDSLFMVVSAMSLTGMNTVNLSDLNTAQQVQLYVLMILGSPILVSIAVLYARKRDFQTTAGIGSRTRSKCSNFCVLRITHTILEILAD